MGANPTSHFLAQIFLDSRLKSESFRGFDWFSWKSGAKIMG